MDLALASFALARRFAAGATLWSWSPSWPHHAQHVAVEFVHPVIVGKRALPAEAVEGADPLPVLRSIVAPGDVLVAIAPASVPEVASVMRRAPAWGIDTIWIGHGARPAAGVANHVLWIEDARVGDARVGDGRVGDGLVGDGKAADGFGGAGAHSGEVVLLYHLLWELTHVCFEHPGLLRPPEPESDPAVCITCSDEARLGEVITTVRPDVASVRTADGAESVDTTLVGPLEAGDLVLIHAGTAIERLEGP